MTQLVARSVSRSVKTGPIAKAESAWRVLGVFEVVCNLIAPSGDVVALVLPEVGDGPLNIVVERPVQPSKLDRAGLFQTIEPSMAASLEGTRFRIGEVELNLDDAVIWEPRPDWDRLRLAGKTIASSLPLLHALALQQAPRDSLLSLLAQDRAHPMADWQPATQEAEYGWGHGVYGVVMGAAALLATGWRGDTVQLRMGAARLAGLGGGVTPAGDDFLLGLMLWAWLAHPSPWRFCEAVFHASALRTTKLSTALLRAAALGECSVPWHCLLMALESGREPLLASTVQDVLSRGHTSGADAVAGFLWMQVSGSLLR